MAACSDQATPFFGVIPSLDACASAPSMCEHIGSRLIVTVRTLMYKQINQLIRTPHNDLFRP